MSLISQFRIMACSPTNQAVASRRWFGLIGQEKSCRPWESLMRTPRSHSLLTGDELLPECLTRMGATVTYGSSVFSPDGSRIVFYSNRAGDGHANLFVNSTNAAGDDQLLLASGSDDVPTSWSRDGQSILFMRFGKVHAGVWVLPLSGDREPKPLLQSSAFDQGAASFSPNGRFIAYSSNESGRFEVYVQRFPPSGDKWMVSSGGGALPLWRDDGKELFYLTEDGKVMSAEIKIGAKFESGVPQQLFQARIKHGTDYPYGVAPDGSRFLINIPAEANDPAPMVVVLDWTATLREKQ